MCVCVACVCLCRWVCVAMMCMGFKCACGMWRLSFTSSPFIFVSHWLINWFMPVWIWSGKTSRARVLRSWEMVSNVWDYKGKEQSYCIALPSMSHTLRKWYFCVCMLVWFIHFMCLPHGDAAYFLNTVYAKEVRYAKKIKLFLFLVIINVMSSGQLCHF